MSSSSDQKSSEPVKAVKPKKRMHWFLRSIAWFFGLIFAGILSVLLVLAVAIAVALPNLPNVADLADYRPKLPIFIYAADGTLIGEYGEERRTLTPLKDIPKVMRDAVVAIEDMRFYQHGGIDFKGMARAGMANFSKMNSQGASTITMQVARNVYLSSEKTLTRKFYEILLTYKMENALTKDQILEIYMNQIYLGNRSYGFSTACEQYFGKPIKDITLAEAAMLAGLPKAPSAYNPIVNPSRAHKRQQYIIERMEEQGLVSHDQAVAAKAQEIVIKPPTAVPTTVHAEYVAETVRMLIQEHYGAEVYTRGMHVYTTLDTGLQNVAYKALRRALINFDDRHSFRGPEKFIDLPAKDDDIEEIVDDALTEAGDMDDIVPAVVLQANERKVVAMRPNGEIISLQGSQLGAVWTGLLSGAPANIKIRRGAIIRVQQQANKSWETFQPPEVEGAFVAMDPRDGAVRALIGGFDYNKSRYNHVTQAYRQPGSTFKPFVYSAGLEKGLMPSTLINDEKIDLHSAYTGGQHWNPKNADGQYEGPMTMRRGLARSKNMIAIRVQQAVGSQNAQDWVTRFGFEAAKVPAYPTMALGAGLVTPMQLVAGYTILANGGYRVTPRLITKITDHKGKILSEPLPTPLNESNRVIDARNAFIMTSLLGEVTHSGTAAKAGAALGRPDIYGKTGTTNEAVDAWFAGYHPHLAAAVWMGYDSPRSLGTRESGGGLSMPIWITFMRAALAKEPVIKPVVPEGVTKAGGDWAYDDLGSGAVRSVGLTGKTPVNDIVQPQKVARKTPSRRQQENDDDEEDDNNDSRPARKPVAAREKKEILDLFKE